MDRVFNFAAGPSMMPLSVLEKAQKEMLSYEGSGMNVMEMTHRGSLYLSIFDKTERLFRELAGLDDSYAVLFLQGGATGQFAATAMNLSALGNCAGYLDSGNFAHIAMNEAAKYTQVACLASTRDINYRSVPVLPEGSIRPGMSYVYMTTNNTIFGTRYSRIPDTGDTVLVADMSSNIFSEVYDFTRFGAVIAGAQKNIGPAGLTIVVVRRSLLGHALEITPQIMDWSIMDKKGSMLNTPPTYAIYMAGLCLEWLKDNGGISEIEKINIQKSALLYDVIDSADFYRGAADPSSRSRMNVTFFTRDADTDAKFVREAAESGLVNIKGHRLVNGLRASIYNAMPIEGVERLCDFMRKFEKENR